MTGVTFDFVDLFAGVGGFHAVLSAFGGKGVLAAEIDEHAAQVYESNWGLRPVGDVVDLAANVGERVPDHLVLAGGFPCQPFSKGGHQRGMGELRGQMFNEVLRILEHKKPAVVFLENVRNLVGPRQRPVWDAIILGLRDAGYKVPSEPAVFSPHLLPPRLGGSPQVRERIYILATYVGPERAHSETDIEPVLTKRPVDGWDPGDWDLQRDVLQGQHEVRGLSRYVLSDVEREWVAVWNDFLDMVRPARLPSFPMWSKYWRDDAQIDPLAPQWKQNFEGKNIQFYRENRPDILRWLRRHEMRLRSFPASRQKLEWQAQGGPRRLEACLLHLRPSGIRAKRPTYAPALVAMAQTPVYGPEMRRLTPREAARLQGFPDWFDFGTQPDIKSYKQMGNAIHLGSAYFAFRRHILANASDIEAAGAAHLVASVKASPNIPRLPEPRMRHPLVASPC